MSEPVAYIHESGLITGEDKDYRAGARTALCRYPDPRVAELESVLRECREVLVDVKWGEDGKVIEAIAKIDEVLK